MKIRLIAILCLWICVLFLTGCPAMILDRMKNKRELSVENISFNKDKYHTIAIIPYSYSERYIDGINLGYANKLFEVSLNELKKLGYTVIEKDRILEYLEKEHIDITNEDMGLVLSRITQDNNIHKIGAGLHVDAIMVVDVVKLTRGFWYTGNCTELNVLLYDGKTEELIWSGYSNVIHESQKNYREKVFEIVFHRLFQDLK